MSVQWAEPLWLLLLPLVPAWLVWTARRGGRAIPLPRGGAAGAGGGWPVSALALTPRLLRAAALLFLVLALARPRTPGGVTEERTDGVPIVIALDVSSSMLAQDFRPRNRLEVAKQTVSRFVAARPDDPIGLVAFAAEAITLVPVTLQKAVLQGSLQSLAVGLLEDGTAIGEGLATAVNRLRRMPGEAGVVILMSDGESNRGEIDPLQAAQAAAAFGIRVFTIGVGSDGVAPVPVRRAGSGLRYAELPVGIDETLLREVATVTGGRYFRATDPEGLRQIYGQIDRLVKSPAEVRRLVRYREWYLPLLMAAALALLAEWLLRGSRWGVLPE